MEKAEAAAIEYAEVQAEVAREMGRNDKAAESEATARRRGGGGGGGGDGGVGVGGGAEAATRTS